MNLKIALKNVKVAHKALVKAHAGRLAGENAMNEARRTLLALREVRNVAQAAADEPNANKTHWIALGRALERYDVAGKAYDLAENVVHTTVRYQLDRAHGAHNSALDNAWWQQRYQDHAAKG
jgi:hypothetical protein